MFQPPKHVFEKIFLAASDKEKQGNGGKKDKKRPAPRCEERAF